MSNKEQKQHFTTPMQFSQSELEARQEKAKAQYLNGHYDHQSRDFVYPSTTLHSFNNLEELVDFVAEKALEGCPRFPGYMMRSGIAYYDIRVMKPKQQQEQELQALFEQVETDYRSELAHDLEAKRQILINQMVAQEKAKEEKKAQEKEQKLLAQATADADAYISSLIKEQK